MKAFHAFFAIALATALLLQGSAFAATQGSLGTTSTATAVITVVIPAQFRISSMNDLALGAYSGAAMNGNDDLCVYTNGTGSYRVRATDSSSLSPTDFSAQNAAASGHIPFAVRWNNTTGIAGNALLSYNTPSSKTGANTQSIDCSIGGNSANLEVRFAKNDLQKALGGAYSSTLTVVIEP